MKTRKSDHSDLLHGRLVPDPYRWLEDPNSDETRAWIDAQNAETFAFLEKIPERDALVKRLTKLWDYERYGAPAKEGSRWFYFKNDGLQNQAVLWVTEDLAQPGRVLLDPNKLSTDGTVALAGMSIREDGQLMAYGLSKSGSDWTEWRVRDVETGVDLPDKVEWVRFSGASWAHDGSGFYYSAYDPPAPGEEYTAKALHQKLFFHSLGGGDRLVYERPDQPEWGFSGSVTEDGRYLVIGVWQGTDPRTRIFYKEGDEPVVELLPDADAAWRFVGNDGERFFFTTDLDAPRGRVVAIDVGTRQRHELIPQLDETLENVSYVGDRLICSYLKDAHTLVRVHDTQGKHLYDVQLPGLGTAVGFGGHERDTDTYFTYTDFITPSAIYRMDVATGKATLWRAPKVHFDPTAFETKQVFVTSKDGTKVPMFLCHKKGLVLDGSHRTQLYGYGGFNIPLTPAFEVSRVVWMEQGGVAAIANLRGGGEYGEEWHQAGCKANKQNVFDDFIACAEWLVANRYTTASRLGVRGSSNGGLLVGACLVQRPELFGAAIPDVGVLDMLRFHKFTIGWAWKSDYGDPDEAKDFEVIFKYSPYHNARPGRYPATMVTTADTDDRVVSMHSFKFAAALQEAQQGDAPILIRIEKRAGHGAGKPTAKVIQSIADQWAFLLATLR